MFSSTHTYGDFKGRRLFGIVCIFLFLFLLPKASAVEINISEPKNITYPYSVGIPLEYAVTADATLCYYTIENGIRNITISNCNEEWKIGVNFDDSYTLVLYAENGTDVASDSIIFEVSRDFTSTKGIVVAGIIVLIAGLIFFCGFIAKSLGSKFEGLNYFFFGLCFVFMIVMTMIAYNSAREYLKVPAFNDLLMLLFYIIGIVLFLSLVYFIMYILMWKKFIKDMEEKDDSL